MILGVAQEIKTLCDEFAKFPHKSEISQEKFNCYGIPIEMCANKQHNLPMPMR